MNQEKASVVVLAAEPQRPVRGLRQAPWEEAGGCSSTLDSRTRATQETQGPCVMVRPRQGSSGGGGGKSSSPIEKDQYRKYLHTLLFSEL